MNYSSAQALRNQGYPDLNSQSATLYVRACDVMPGGNTRLAVYQSPYPIYFERAEGSIVTDVDGVSRIDFINNQSALIHGHCFAPAMRRVREQLSRGTCFSGPSQLDVELAELLSARSPGFEQIRFTNSGTEAVMVAVKAARAFTGKPKIAKCEGAYHGTYDFIETSRGSTPKNWGDPGHPASIPYVQGTPAAVAANTVVFRFNEIESTRKILDQQKHELAAVILEPIVNRGGMIMADPKFINFIRQYCTENNILLILDEIISFRLGFGGAQGVYGIKADITTLGKFVGGGFPTGAVLGRKDVMKVFDPRDGAPAVPHTGTFNGNPISMVAGIETLKALDTKRIDDLNRKGDRLRAALTEKMRKRGVEGQVTGGGSLFRVHFIGGVLTDYRSSYPNPDAAMRIKALHRQLLNNGILLSVNASGNISSAHTDEQIEQFIDTFERVLEGAYNKEGMEVA
jgi:glutamate-1-semialdehyde 2,1-aminomutase